MKKILFKVFVLSFLLTGLFLVNHKVDAKMVSCDTILYNREVCIGTSPDFESMISCINGSGDMNGCQYDYDFCPAAQQAADQCGSIPQDTGDGIRAYNTCIQKSRVGSCV